ncbi:MAG: lipid-A-disaccharide synthase N-terminal domain-containing protein [Thermodesulfobacteriota bacterium]
MTLLNVMAIDPAGSLPAWVWTTVGFLGQAVFGARFVVQWIASEIRKESYVPLAFWFLSVAGGCVLLSYAIHRKDPVFIAGQAGGLLIYIRNLFLIFRRKRAQQERES